MIYNVHSGVLDCTAGDQGGEVQQQSTFLLRARNRKTKPFSHQWGQILKHVNSLGTNRSLIMDPTGPGTKNDYEY
jgi:hypothetical protein